MDIAMIKQKTKYEPHAFNGQFMANFIYSIFLLNCKTKQEEKATERARLSQA